MKRALLLVLVQISVLYSFAQYSDHSFTFGGISRQYRLYVPPVYDSTRPTPFVLALHGLGDTKNNFAAGIAMNKVADTANFIFAVPQAIVDNVLTGQSAWNSGAGEFGITLNPNIDDVGFLNALIDSVSTVYNIDQTRVYSTGFSMGAFMTNRLGCELNNRIAAIASVSGTIGNGITCNPTRDVPACHFHGTKDSTIYYVGDPFGSDPEALVAYWRSHNHCDSLPSAIDTMPNTVNDGLTVVRYTYPNGRFGTEVEFYKVINGQHQWLTAANDVNFAVEVWRFFRRFQWTDQSTAIADIPEDLKVSVYPNPANTSFNIQLPATEEKITEVRIADVTGKVLYFNQHVLAGQLLQVNLPQASGLNIISVNVGGRWINTKLVLNN